MINPSPKPICSLCRFAEAARWCSTHKEAFCGACANHHETGSCVWFPAPPLRLMRSTQMSLKFEESSQPSIVN